MLVRNGLDRKKTLESVTIEPAKLLGIDKSHGSLEKGKKAIFHSMKWSGKNFAKPSEKDVRIDFNEEFDEKDKHLVW